MPSAILIKDSTAPSGFRRVDTGAPGPAGQNGATPQGFNPRGAWAPNTNYAPFDIVTRDGSTYASSTTFTSGATFNAANWNLWAAKGAGVPAGGGAGQILAKATGADYDAAWVNAPSGGTSVPAVSATSTTTDLCVGGAASASSQYSTEYVADYAFDSIDSTRWASLAATGSLNYNRGNNNVATPVAVKIYPHLDFGGTNDAPRSFNFKGRTNGGAWTTLLSVTNYSWTSTNPNTWTFANSATFTEFQLDVTAILGSNASIRKLEIFGPASSGTSGTVTGYDKLNLNSMLSPKSTTSLGNVVGKFPVYSATGVLLGYVPLYDPNT